MMTEFSHFITNEKYRTGPTLEFYGNEYSIVEAQESNTDGKVYKKWGYPQAQGRKPLDKSIPWKIKLGNKEGALDILRMMMKEIQDDTDDDVSDNEIPF